ncbi:SURF1 family protein [Pseudoruegeria sp. SK021]|uniref:SURF1 family protein n=1 Tax=Pseudoruegeria sp. SK021 TaxID=1933035 RepID=UPI000A2392C6|nr:SURF1 family protein [Pseudoruegeria sp. SK021]OSP56516.1 cytochrome oxidase biogenesis protein Surf1, facilitates heme A insertion [Pseudoruegeria sp. SK021]
MTRRMILPLLFGIAGTALLIWLGLWQMQRLAWKEAILADLDARIAGAPVSLPAQVDPVDDAFLPVTATGTILADEIIVQSSLKLVGPGFRVIAPFETGGRRILLDRGFIRLTDRDRVRPEVTATITGNLHWPDEVDGFTPDPDVAGGMWFARDIDSLAAALNTEPVLLVARTTSENPLAVTPLPVASAGIPNDHLQYAVTWFLMAVVWVGMTLYLLVTLRRRASEG